MYFSPYNDAHFLFRCDSNHTQKLSSLLKVRFDGKMKRHNIDDHNGIIKIKFQFIGYHIKYCAINNSSISIHFFAFLLFTSWYLPLF